MSRIHKSAKHRTTSDTPDSESQADGTAADAPRGETQAQPAPTEGVENAGAIPSCKGPPLNDTFGEAGDPYGRGNLEIPDTIIKKKKKRKRDEEAA
jgi:hypothetical protein